jgi:hypothetical protein
MMAMMMSGSSSIYQGGDGSRFSPQEEIEKLI